jgi:hypothetical protein
MLSVLSEVGNQDLLHYMEYNPLAIRTISRGESIACHQHNPCPNRLVDIEDS